MANTATLYRVFEKTLEYVTMFLMVALAMIVVIGVGFRWADNALEWYDEVASVLLAWLTYYGAALGALKRAHIGMPGIVNAMRPKFRLPCVIVAETSVFLFLGGMTYYGMMVMDVLAGETLVTLESVSLQFVQSVIPFGAILYIVAELFNLPQILREAVGKAEAKTGH